MPPNPEDPDDPGDPFDIGEAPLEAFIPAAVPATFTYEMPALRWSRSAFQGNMSKPMSKSNQVKKRLRFVIRRHDQGVVPPYCQVVEITLRRGDDAARRLCEDQVAEYDPGYIVNRETWRAAYSIGETGYESRNPFYAITCEEEPEFNEWGEFSP